MARVGLFVGFIVGGIKTKGLLSKKQLGFLNSLMVAGTLYILSFPLFYFLSYVVEPVL